jgi:flagellar hook-basal body complex protein FliE
MIDPVSAQSALQGLQRANPALEGAPISTVRGARLGGELDHATETGRTSFGDLIGQLVSDVDAKGKAAEGEVRKLMVGESDNIHASMIAMQEAGVAFTLLLEVRNKLVESYQELMRMPV